MIQLGKFKNSFFNSPYLFLMGVSFFVWVLSFKGFLFGQLSLAFDAGPYYGHTKFFIYNLAKGVFPLWDPTWVNGAPNEFFLRRMGDVNPLYLVMTLLYKLGLPFTFTYLWTLTAYFFLGTIGFYKLAECLFKDKRFAFAAFLILLFSSLGTRIFDSFIIILFVPMSWFFFFLLTFLKSPSKTSFVGLTFCFMVLMVTYIPFYFLSVLFFSLACLIVFNFKFTTQCFKNSLRFFSKNRVASLLCCFAILSSLYPGVKFYQSSGGDDFVLPVRSVGVEDKSAVEVDFKTVSERGILEEILFARYFDLKGMTFKVVYFPIALIIFILIGLFAVTTKRTIYLFVLCVVLFILGSPQLRIYEFLHAHIFFFKLFRNLFFFLWIALLPAFILFVVSAFCDWVAKSGKSKVDFLYIVLVHCLIAGLLIMVKESLFSSYATVFLSLILCSLVFLKIIKNNVVLLSGILILCALQPVEVFYHFGENAFNKRGEYEYESFSDEFKYFKKESIFDVSHIQGDDLLNKRSSPLYYATKEYDFLYTRVHSGVLNSYVNYAFILYDNISVVPLSALNLFSFAEALKEKRNVAFVNNADENLKFSVDAASSVFVPIREGNDEFTVVESDVNTIKFQTNFLAHKFLVHTGNYHKRWQLFVDGKKEVLHQVNVSFKGIDLPSGKREVVLRFGSSLDYFIKYFLMFIFNGTLLWLIFLIKKKGLDCENN